MKRCNLHIIIVINLLLVLPSVLIGQDVGETYCRLAQRWKKDPLRVTGLLSITGSSYTTSQEFNRAAPFAGRIMAALNFDLLGIRAPFSLALSTGGRAFNYSLPAFAFMGISPSYGWFKMHFGDRSMELGKYTFNRQSFKGVGTELSPGNWRFKAFYGRIRRARPEDFVGIQRIDPFFKRLGWGIQGGYENDKDKILVSLFQAWDDDNSIEVPDSSFQFSPGGNVIVSTLISKQISEKLFLKIDFANSGFTENRHATNELNTSFIKRFGSLLNPNTSTRWGNAWASQLVFKTGFGSINAEWEKIDPGYKTMGSLFFLNDVQNISLGARARIWKKRISANGRIGLQQNNLSGNQANEFNRFIGFLRLNIQATPALNVNVAYSTFNNVNRRVAISDPLNPIPTSELVLSNQDAQVAVNWNLNQSSSKIALLQSTVQFTTGQSIINDEIQPDGETQSLNWITYLYQQFVPTKWNLGFSFSHQVNSFGGSKINTQSMGISTGKQMLEDRLTLQFTGSIGFTNQAFTDQVRLNTILINSNIHAKLKISDQNSIQLNSFLISNQTKTANADFTEWRNMLAYQHRF